VIGTPEHFHCGKQVASYVGLFRRKSLAGTDDGCDTSANRANERLGIHLSLSMNHIELDAACEKLLYTANIRD